MYDVCMDTLRTQASLYVFAQTDACIDGSVWSGVHRYYLYM